MIKNFVLQNFKTNTVYYKLETLSAQFLTKSSIL